VHDYIIWNQEMDRLHISCGSREAFDAAGKDFPPLFFESLSNLAFIAGATSRIRIGVAVLCLPYRQDAVVTAKQIATIDALSKGRIELGVGQGGPKIQKGIDFEVLGISRATKVAKTREYLDAMQKLWTEESPSFAGQFVHYEGATIYPKPVQQPHPPIWIGGQKEQSLNMVADYADGWLPGFLSPSQFPTAIAEVHRKLADRGREPSALTVGTEVQIYLGRTTEEAREVVRPTMSGFGDAFAGAMGGFAASDADPLQEVWNSSLIGSSEAVVEEIGRYVDAGCTLFELKFIYHTIDHLLEQWQKFSEEVAPSFASLPLNA
jgi:alkanesulfonate monooxygenase SsuD/methylene tetrahydromethanopterin reductase-like flavin-dependent oxidoreductase (luciferase family)